MSLSLRAGSIVALLMSFAHYSHAAELIVESSPTASGIAYAISLDGSGVGNFNAFALRAYPDAPATFLNPGPASLSDMPGDDKTFINQLLDGPIEVGNYVMPYQVTTPQEVSFDAGRLGAYVNTEQPIFLSNVVLPTGATGTASIRLLDTGQDVFLQTIRFGIPEPGSVILLGVGAVGLCMGRGNRQ